MLKRMPSAFLLVSLAALALARPNGAPNAACQSMTPRHAGTNSQPSGEVPYMMEVGRVGQWIRVTIKAKGGKAVNFKGFFVQARSDAYGKEMPMGQCCQWH